MKENDTVLTDFNEKDILEEIEEIKKMILQMKIQMQNYYYIVIEEVSLICEDAKHNIYLSQNDFERMLDVLLNYATYVDVKKEFDILINTYLSIYPDSVNNYIKYYNETLEEGIT
jgi:hypothetical protein